MCLTRYCDHCVRSKSQEGGIRSEAARHTLKLKRSDGPNQASAWRRLNISRQLHSFNSSGPVSLASTIGTVVMTRVRQCSTQVRPSERAAKRARDRAARAVRLRRRSQPVQKTAPGAAVPEISGESSGDRQVRRAGDVAARAHRIRHRSEHVREVNSRKRRIPDKKESPPLRAAPRRTIESGPQTADEPPPGGDAQSQQAANAGGLWVITEDTQLEVFGRRVRRHLTQHPHASSRGSGAQPPAAGAQHKGGAFEHERFGVPSQRQYCPRTAPATREASSSAVGGAAQLPPPEAAQPHTFDADLPLSALVAGSRRHVEPEGSETSSVLINVPRAYHAEMVEQPVAKKLQATVDDVTKGLDGMDTDDEDDDKEKYYQHPAAGHRRNRAVLAQAGNQAVSRSPEHQSAPPSPSHSTSSAGGAVGLLSMSSVSSSCMVPLWEPKATDGFPGPSPIQQGDRRLPSETVLADMAVLQGWAPRATKEVKQDTMDNANMLEDDWTT